MPKFEFICEICGRARTGYRDAKSPPRFCSRACRKEGMAGKRCKRPKYPISEEAAAKIEKVYKTDSGNGQVSALAKRLGLPRWKVTRFAQEKGLLAKSKKGPDWTDAEVELLYQFARYTPHVICRKLKERGYDRSITAIIVKLKRCSARQNIDGKSARDIARCLGVDDHNIANAIAAGKLKASRRGTARIEAQGGDIWFIKDSDVRAYVIDYLNEIDIRKVDKHWFVDLLIGDFA